MQSKKGLPFWQLCLFLLPYLIYLPSTNAQVTKGFHVNGFKEILGNSKKEDQLLSFAKEHGFNYLLLYNLHFIHHNLYDLTDPDSSKVLAEFIKKAKTQYGIIQIGMVGEKAASFDWTKEYQENYKYHKLHRIDVYHIEFEFWNKNLVEDYYCTTYLEESGLECSTDGAFEFYIDELEKVKMDYASNGVKLETYLGNISTTQCQAIGEICDRVMVHYYRKSDVYNNGNSIYQYKDYRLEALAPKEGRLAILPLFSAGDQFMGEWLQENPKEKAFITYLSGQAGFHEQQGEWKNHISVEGYHWYRYTDLRTNLKAVSNFVDYQIFDANREQSKPNSGFSLIRTISITRPAPSSPPSLEVILFPNPGNDLVELASDGEKVVLVEVYKNTGELYTTIKGQEIQEKRIDVSDWPEGHFIIRSYSNFDQQVKQLVVKHN